MREPTTAIAKALLVVTLLLAPAAAGAQPLAPAAADAQPPADDGNVVVHLIKDVAIDYKNFVSLDNAPWIGLGGAAAAIMHAGDDTIDHWVVENNPAALTGGAEWGTQYLQLPLAVGWWAIASAAGSTRHAAAGRDLLRAQLSVVGWTYAIKFAADRTRPNGDPRSFPSGHASNSFAAAMVLEEHYGWKVGLPAFLAATYTSVSRVVEHQHWASDVVFGAAVGMTAGRTVTIRLRETRVSIAPLAVPGGGGVMVTALR
ncbi:MAG TPA: phosphatase PAP2 family protein [Vicinamibacterales bacterium]|nr:phosphatase PAP2 family protein [Vicinamibacterales bacterium]